MSRTATLRHILFATLVTIGSFLLLQACGGGGGGGGGAPPAPSTPGVQNFPAGNDPTSVTVNPTGTFVYVANRGSNDISAYALNAASGMLTPIDANAAPGVQNFAAGTTPRSVTVNPAGTFIYVANANSHNISAYALNGDGSLTPIDADSVMPGVQNFPAGTSPISVTVNPAGTFVYVANADSRNISAYALNGDGSLTPIDADSVMPGVQNFPAGTSPISVTVTVTPSGTFVYVANGGSNDISAYALNGDGSLTPIDADAATPGIQNFPAGTAPWSVTVNPAGTFIYVANKNSHNISAYALNGDGSLTPIDADAGTPGTQNFAAGSNPESVTVTPSGTYVYVANSSSNDVSAYTINANGSLTPIDADAATPGIQNFAAGTFPRSVTVTPSGTFVYVANGGSNDISAYALNAASGMLTPIDAIP